MKIAVAGAGYVGLPIAALLSRSYDVAVQDIDEKKVQLINKGLSPVRQIELQREIMFGRVKATVNADQAFKDARYVIIAVPTNLKNGSLDCSIVEDVIRKVARVNSKATIVIKSTVKVGFTQYASRYANDNNVLLFSPQFLRQGHSMGDNLRPSRIIVGYGHSKDIQEARKFGQLMKSITSNPARNTVLYFDGWSQAEAVKLFSNAYLAMRVAFFNELDTYSEEKNLNADAIIQGMAYDERIGFGYNNPSFGYGGYCLPKDTKNLDFSFGLTSHPLISGINRSNDSRIKHIAQKLASLHNENGGPVGIYKLAMKQGSDNFRESAALEVIKILRQFDIPVIVYDPKCDAQQIEGVQLANNLWEFKERSGVIAANRYDQQLNDVRYKVYTRDLFHEN